MNKDVILVICNLSMALCVSVLYFKIFVSRLFRCYIPLVKCNAFRGQKIFLIRVSG